MVIGNIVAVCWGGNQNQGGVYIFRVGFKPTLIQWAGVRLSFSPFIQSQLWCQMVTLGHHLAHAGRNFEISVLPLFAPQKS